MSDNRKNYTFDEDVKAEAEADSIDPSEPSLRDNFKKSIVDVLLTFPVMGAWYVGFTLFVMWYIDKITVHGALIISASLFNAFVGFVYFTLGEHFEAGKKKIGLFLLSIIVFIVPSLNIILTDAEFMKGGVSFFESNSDSDSGSGEKKRPDHKIYQPGSYSFSLKAGEKTDHWVVFPSGRLTSFNISSSDNMFKIQYRDGKIVQAWNPGKFSNKKGRSGDFKIIAVTDQPQIKLLVR